MLEIVICDDEKNLRRNLCHIIEMNLELRGIAYHITEFDCGEALLSACKISSFNIVFLDIEMKELNGIETAKSLREKNKSAIIIFVTSYPDFVFQGYEVRALNYILKPYQKEKILSVLHLALEELHALAEQYYIIEQQSGAVKLPLHEIKYIKSDRRFLIAVTNTGNYSFYGKLNEVELTLPDYFIRIHNRYLVSIHYVTALEHTTVIINQESLPISRSRKQELSVAFAKYMLH